LTGDLPAARFFDEPFVDEPFFDALFFDEPFVAEPRAPRFAADPFELLVADLLDFLELLEADLLDFLFPFLAAIASPLVNQISHATKTYTRCHFEK